MIRLYIENREIELDKTVQFAITKQFEDLSNPTTIINDWSKTVSIPFTYKNHNTFGHIYNPDKAIIDASVSNYTGIYFDPLRKLDFRLEWDNAILMIGYAKMNEIKRKGASGTYEVTLFGQLGKVFQEMQKITFDTTTEDTNYLIDGSLYVNETINKELVYDSWTSYGQYEFDLHKRGTSLYNVHDIIGFAPNNSISENFDYKTYQHINTDNGNDEALKFTDTLGDSFTTATGITPDTAIPNGMLPREIGEYRSYYQLPYIYWNKLFQIFQEKSEEITGYTFDLDNTWFTDNNPYYTGLVYMLKPLSSIKNTTYNNRYSEKTQSQHVVYANSGQKYHYSFDTYEPGLNWGVDSEQIPILMNPETAYPHYFHFTSSDVINGQLTVNFKLQAQCNLGSQKSVHIRNNAVFVIDVFLTDQAIGHPETSHIQLGRICVKWSDSSYVAGNTTYTVNVPTTSIPSGSYTWTLFSGAYSFNIPSNLYNKDYKISFGLNGWHAETAFSGSLFVDTNPSSVDLGNLTLYCGTGNGLSLNVTPLVGKSFSPFTLNDLWNKDFNLFGEIIKYCKMYRIIIYMDEVNKKIVFKTLPTFFQNYSIVDWTKKIDKSKDFIVKPITFDNKYVLFNYNDSKTKIAEDYKEKYGFNYGEYRLTTDYNFNTETTKLFDKDKIPQSIINTDNVLSWNNLCSQHKIIYSFPNEKYVYNKNKDNKQVDIFGTMYFYTGTKAFNTEPALNLRSVKISDDTTFQQANSTYFYTQDAGPYVSVPTYQALDILKDNNMCVFNLPKENYTYQNNYAGKKSIYYNFWEKYLNERYNIQNKKVTCYVNLKPTDWSNFQFNKFVKINNQIYIVNKIYDFDITENKTTKVDLITIQDVSAYTSNNFEFTPGVLTVTPNEITIPYDYTKRVLVHSSGNWSIKDDDTRDYISTYPSEGGPGDTWVYLSTLNEEIGAILLFQLYNDDYDVVVSKSVTVSVGGTSSISTDGWIKYPTQGGTATFSLTSSAPWHLMETDKSGSSVVTLSPTSGPAGTTTITMSASLTGSGLTDFYIGNDNGDIVMERAYVSQPYVTFSTNPVHLNAGSSTTLTISNSAISRWQIESSTGNADVTITPNTGQASGSTNVTITAGNTVGEKTFVFGVTGSPGYNTATLKVYVE